MLLLSIIDLSCHNISERSCAIYFPKENELRIRYTSLFIDSYGLLKIIPIESRIWSLIVPVSVPIVPFKLPVVCPICYHSPIIFRVPRSREMVINKSNYSNFAVVINTKTERSNSYPAINESSSPRSSSFC